MKKTILIFIFFLFLTLLLFCQESENLKVESVELSIGFGYNHSLIAMQKQIYRYPHKYPEEKENIYSGYFVPQGQGIMFSVPVSIIFYVTKSMGIGLINNFGFNIYLLYGYLPMIFEFINSCFFVNKLGIHDKKNFFVLEYGLVLVNSIVTDHYVIDLPNNKFDASYVNYTFHVGPGLFIGYERLFKKNSIVVGGTFNSTFWMNKDFDDNSRIVEEFKTTYRFGVEFRIRHHWIF